MSGKSKPQMAPERLNGVSLIIACEGEKTEPRYFEDLRRALNIRQHSISILRGQGSNPLDVVSRAAKVRLVARRQGRWNDKSQSYVKDHLLARTKTAIANANRVHILGVENELSEYRNPCAHVKDLVQRIWELGNVLPPQLPPLIRENMAEYVASLPLLAGTY